MICSKNSESAEIAADFLIRGKICILPTDTVYGFSGISEWCAENEKKFFTDRKIGEIKGRSENKPLIQLVSSVEKIEFYSAQKIPSALKEKMPGAITVIVPLKKEFAQKTGMESVAFRCPGDEWLRSVIEKCGSPVFSTSVNRSGEKFLEKISGIKSEFESSADLIVDDGDKSALPSTLVSLDGEKWKILRQGSVIV